MIKAIIFDFFDVIRSDPYNSWLKNHGFSREGKFLEVVEELDSGRISNVEFRNTLSVISGQSIGDLNNEFENTNKIDTDVVGLIQQLAKNYKIGLLSNAPSKYIRDILQESKLEQHFNEIVISSEVGYTKPSKEIFEIMLNRLNVNAANVLFIDDNKIHIDGGEKIGIKGIVFVNASQLKEALKIHGVEI